MHEVNFILLGFNVSILHYELFPTYTSKSGTLKRSPVNSGKFEHVWICPTQKYNQNIIF